MRRFLILLEPFSARTAARPIRRFPRGIVILLAAGLALAAPPPAAPIAASEPHRLDAWQTEQGLPQNTVSSIVQTTDGYLWLATQEGLVRFDGVRFKVFSPSNSPGLTSLALIRLLAGPDGTLWISTDGGGLGRFRDGKFTSLTRRHGLPHDRVQVLLADGEGGVWIGTARGLARLHRDGHLAAVPLAGLTDPSVTALARDREGGSGSAPPTPVFSTSWTAASSR